MISNSVFNRADLQTSLQPIAEQAHSGALPEKVNFSNHVEAAQPIVIKGWHERTILKLNEVDRKLDELIPNFSIQNRIDALGEAIEKKFAPLVTFNKWLNSTGQGSWYRKLAIHLAKLPALAARNIIQQLYTIIRGIVYGAVHPLKATNNLLKMLVTLAHELTKPETWAKIGATTIGTSMGQAAIGGNLLSLIGLGIGGALVVGGVSLGAVKSALYAEKDKRMDAVKQHLLKQAQDLSETVVTGFAMGLIIGGIKRAYRERLAKAVEQKKNEPELIHHEEGKITHALKASHSSKLPKHFPSSLYTDEVRMGSGPNGGLQHTAFFEKTGGLKKDITAVSVNIDPTGITPNNTQYLYHGKELISTTNQWYFENINGYTYVVWEHKDVLVYAGDFDALILKI